MIGFLLLLRVHIITSIQALKGLRGRGIFFFIIPLKSQYFKRNYSTAERKSLNASVGTSRCCVRRDERARLVPNNSNSPSYSMALKGRKSLPNRLSLVNSYNFVIRENCRKCKTTVPNCDLSKLMPLITVAGETRGKLEVGPRPSLLPRAGRVQATLPQLAGQLRLAHVALPLPQQASLERAGFSSPSPPSEQPFVGSRL